MLIEFVIKLSRASCSYFHIKRFIKFDKNCVTALTVTYIEFKKELTDNQADCQPMNKAVCGSSTGLIKVVDVKSKTIAATYGSQCLDQSIAKLQISSDSRLAIAARKSGLVTMTSLETGKVTKSINFQNRDPIGLSVLDNDQILVCDSFGHVKIASSESESVVDSWKVADNCRGFHSDRLRIACGGKEQDLKVWDTDRRSVIFQAKNVALDKLSLRKPICINAIALGSTDPNLITTGTAYHQIRLYDTRRGRRPVLDKVVAENAIIAIAVGPGGHHVFAGDGIGGLHQYDLRMEFRVLGRYRGPTGSIRSIDIDNSTGLMASVGLDRMLYIHDISTRKLSARVYLKQGLNAVCWMNDLKLDSNTIAKDSDHEPEGDDDDLWNEMESIEDDHDEDPDASIIKRPSKRSKTDADSIAE